ncbi:MAG: BglG family transcription antiterminator [Anaerorhabdus sp.]
MASEKKRILWLFHILTIQEGYIRSQDLAEQAGVTERTIKSDAKDLEAFALASGAVLKSKKGTGYILEVVDEKIYEDVKNQLTIQFIYTQNLTCKGTYRRTNDILRRIIVEKSFLTIDDLADELYLTRSSIKEEMKQVREILKCYNMTIKKKNEEGYLIQGEEFNRRMLMLSLFEVHYHEALTLFKNAEFLKYFNRDDEERYEIRQIFLQTIRETSCYVTDEQKISRYLCLMASRRKEGNLVGLKGKDITWLQSFEQYHIAEMIMTNLNVLHSDFVMDEQEIAALALVLLCANAIPESCAVEKAYATVIPEINEFIELFMDVVEKEEMINLRQIDGYVRKLQNALIPIFCQNKFKVAGYYVESIYRFDYCVRNSPLSLYIANYAVKAFKVHKGSELSPTNALSIAARIRVILQEIEYSFKPLKATVVSHSSFDSAYSMRKTIQIRLGRFFECLDVRELYELRKIAVDSYDVAILCLPEFTYKYDWPYLVVDEIITQKQMNEIYNQVILKGVQLEKIMERIQLSEIGIYEDFEFDHMESFYKLLSFKVGNSSSSINKIYEELIDGKKVLCYKKTCIIFINRKYITKNIFDLYRLKQSKLCNDNDITDIFVISVDYQNDLERVRFIDNLAYQIINGETSANEIAEAKSKDILMKLVRDSLKTIPISLK